ncbi:hypothetical protein ACT91Q_01475 [Brevibacillus thermoruber]|uniref:hypothetical protein n=1 Tax=Brevibacillus thermoruber TaxID=33942 RepID=UPI0040431465
MEYILENTDIFDEEIDANFKHVLLNNMDSLQNKVYSLTVSFHVNLLHSNRFDKCAILPSKSNDGSREDKIYDVLSFQLNKLVQLLAEFGIEVFSATIQGDILEAENIVKISLIEDTSEQLVTGKREKQQMMRVISIIPSLPYTHKTASKLASEKLNNIFSDLINIIKDRKLFSEILGIEETENYGTLFKAFVEQYGELWLATDDRRDELLNRLMERSTFVINKRLEKEKEA